MNYSSGLQEVDQYKVAAFYCFDDLSDNNIPNIINCLYKIAQAKNIKGTVLIASEGINGTICGEKESVTLVVNELRKIFGNESLVVKFSYSSEQAFKRLKVRKKNEIVTMGIKGVNPNEMTGEYVEPKDWNDFIDDPKTLVIDTRNKYEVHIGTFKGSFNPETNTFSEFPLWVDNNLKTLIKDKNINRVAMFCTGGIRCEKATSYLKKTGFKDVYHLRGGILKYLEEIPSGESRWEGECFVFDQRVALNHELDPGIYQLCYACGMPLSPEDRNHINYQAGIKCDFCKDQYSESDRARFAERHNQFLARNISPFPGNI